MISPLARTVQSNYSATPTKTGARRRGVHAVPARDTACICTLQPRAADRRPYPAAKTTATACRIVADAWQDSPEPRRDGSLTHTQKHKHWADGVRRRVSLLWGRPRSKASEVQGNKAPAKVTASPTRSPDSKRPRQ